MFQAIMLVDGVTAYPDATFNLMTGATVVIMASIIWLAIRGPKEAITASSRETTVVGDDLTDKELHSINQS